MKKLISLILAFAMIFALAMPAMAADTTKTIYFKNSAGWSKINAYCWTAGTDQGGPQPWPGASLTHVADDVYSIEIPAEYDMVIFNNGSVQTGDLSIPTDGRNMYEYGPNEWSTYTPAPKTQSDVTASYTPSTISALPNPLYFKGEGVNQVIVGTYSSNGSVASNQDDQSDFQMLAVDGETGTFYVDTSDFSAETAKVSFCIDGSWDSVMEIPAGNNMYDYDKKEWTTYTPGTPDPVAKITGAIVYVNDVEQLVGDIFITAGDTVKVVFHGENFDYLTTDYAYRIGSKDGRMGSLDVVIGDNTAIASFAASALSNSNNSSVAYVNAGEDMTETGYTLTYLEKGTDLTTIYFKNTAGWEKPHIRFYNSRGNQLETAKLTLVGGESDIYSAEVPENKWIYQVDFYDNATATYAERQTIPTDGSDQYNYDSNSWSVFTPTVHTTTSANISWGSMAFTFTDGTNGAENGTWTADTAEKAGQVTVTNAGTTTFTATPSFADKEDDYGIFSGSLSGSSLVLSSNRSMHFVPATPS